MANKPSYDGVKTFKPSGLSREKVTTTTQDKVSTKQPNSPTPSPRGYA